MTTHESARQRAVADRNNASLQRHNERRLDLCIRRTFGIVNPPPLPLFYRLALALRPQA